MLLKEKTKQKFGYDIEELEKHSGLFVYWKCDQCGHEGTLVYSYYLKNKKGDKKGERCQKCLHKHRKGRYVIDLDRNSHLELPPEVLFQETLDKYGYDPRDLSPWSRKWILVRCSVRGTIHSTRRSALNRNKAILETGHYISTGGYAGQRRKGVKASKETKMRMSKSQALRRKLEKDLINNNNLTKEN